MKHVLIVAVAGALGALSRYGLLQLVGSRFFPWGTFAINVIGSCLMGLAYVIIVEKTLVSPDMKPLFMVGFLGAFTTFSAFSFEAWLLMERGELLHAVSYIALTVLLCIAALAFGVFVARLTF
mgnify:FL=1